MVSIDNDTKCEIDIDLLNKIAENFTDKEIELAIINDDEMKNLNKQTRGIDKSTDVLSFPLEQMPHVPLGSIVINEKKVYEACIESAHSQKEEVALLFIHGLLHLLGYDHDNDNGEMRAMEEETIKKFNLPKSLIVRVEG
ncbi:MAG: rRNA maturation RNase YbeY [Sulfurospirillaceae bacterium]|nr:rRNA maturation RNase YbeY [Sulfurospirillaceae bacterium]